MEIVLGILLLFGAFTLGAVTSDSADHESHAVQMETDDTGLFEQTVVASPLQTCQTGRSTQTYRDLTVPYARPVDQKPAPADDGEVGCWDE